MVKFVCLVIAVLGLAVVALCEEENLMEKATNDMAECQKSEGASNEDIERFKAREEPTTKEAKCFVGCFFDKFGLLENGAFSRKKADDKAKASSMAEEPEVLELILKANEDCEKEVGTTTDKCETGPKLAACFKKAHDSMRK